MSIENFLSFQLIWLLTGSFGVLLAKNPKISQALCVLCIIPLIALYGSNVFIEISPIHIAKYKSLVLANISFFALIVSLFIKLSKLEYTLLLLALVSVFVVMFSDSIIDIYLSFELLAFILIALISFKNLNKKLAVKLIIYNCLASVSFLLAIFLIYYSYSSYNLTEITMKLGNQKQLFEIKIAFSLLIISLFTKLYFLIDNKFQFEIFFKKVTFLSYFVIAIYIPVHFIFLLHIIHNVMQINFAFDILYLDNILIFLSISFTIYFGFKTLFNKSSKVIIAYNFIISLAFIFLLLSLEDKNISKIYLIAIISNILAIFALYLSLNTIRTKQNIIIASSLVIGVPFSPMFFAKWQAIDILIKQENILLLTSLFFISLVNIIVLAKLINLTKLNKYPSNQNIAFYLTVLLSFILGVFSQNF